MFIMFPERILFNHRGHEEHRGMFQADTQILQDFPRLSTNCTSSFSTPCSPCAPWLVPVQPRSARDLLKTKNRKLNTFSAFSLIELLVVVAILGLLIGAAAPALNSVLEAGRMTQAVTALGGQFTTARLKAIAENRPVTVRFIRPNTSSSYDRVQLVTLDTAGNATAVGRVVTLPMATAIAKSTTLSSLIDPSKESPATSLKDPTLPELGSNYRYVQFSFRPRGSLDLGVTQQWFATVLLLRDDQSGTTTPANFATIQIDPVNGGLQVYRP